MGETFGKAELLRTRREIHRVFEGCRVVGDTISLWYLKGGRRRFGFLVYRSAGGAVVRNRWRRWLKEICRRNKDAFPEDYDYLLLVARPQKVDFLKLKAEVLSLASRVGDG